MSEIVQTEIPYNILAVNVRSTPCANQYWHSTSQCGTNTMEGAYSFRRQSDCRGSCVERACGFDYTWLYCWAVLNSKVKIFVCG